MSNRYEITKLHENESVMKISLHKLKNDFKHWNENLEIFFVLSGQLSVDVDDNSYRFVEDDIYLVNPNQIQELKTLGCVLIILQVNLSFLEEMFPGHGTGVRFNCNSSLFRDKSAFHNIKVLIARLVKRNSEKGKYIEFLNKSMLYELFYELLNNFMIVDGELPSTSRKNIDRINRIIRYINENYASYISLENLAENENLTVPYLSRFFKESIGQTFKSFLNRVRLFHAVSDLISTDKTIMQIAFDAGFSNTRSFTTIFREEYGENPDQYRKNNDIKFRQKKDEIDYTVIEQSEYLKKLTQYLDGDLRPPVLVEKNDWETIVSPEINCRRSYRELNHSFKKLLSLNDAKSLLYKEIQDMMVEVQEEIGFEYVILKGFFADSAAEYMQSDEAEPVFHFCLVDKIIDFILSIGLKPFIKLGLEVNKTSLLTSVTRDRDEVTVILNKWKTLIDSLLTHIIERYGINAVVTWKFCLQEEFERSKLTISRENEKRYKKIYYTTYSVIKSHSKDINFGPSPLMPYMLSDSMLLSRFLEYFVTENCVPDFLAIKYFPVIPEGEKKPRRFFLDRNPDAMKDFIDRLSEQISEGGCPDIPVYITDWNSSTSNNDLLNDTCFKSAYIVRNIIRNYDRLQSYGYLGLSDFNLEMPSGRELFHGGLGLYTKNGIKKPSYYALWLLSKLGRQLVAKGDDYIITEEDGVYRILTCNYCHYSALYASGERFDMTFRERYTPFERAKTIEYKFNLTRLQDGEYMMKRYTVNRLTGSSFDTWLRMSPEEIIDKEGLTMLKNHSSPGMEIKLISVQNGELNLELEIEPHGIQLVTLVKR